MNYSSTIKALFLTSGIGVICITALWAGVRIDVQNNSDSLPVVTKTTGLRASLNSDRISYSMKDGKNVPVNYLVNFGNPSTPIVYSGTNMVSDVAANEVLTPFITARTAFDVPSSKSTNNWGDMPNISGVSFTRMPDGSIKVVNTTSNSYVITSDGFENEIIDGKTYKKEVPTISLQFLSGNSTVVITSTPTINPMLLKVEDVVSYQVSK